MHSDMIIAFSLCCPFCAFAAYWVRFSILNSEFCVSRSSLVVPFVRFGEVMSGGPHFPLTSDALKKVFTGQASREVILSVAHAVSSQIGCNQGSCSISHE